MGNGSKYGKYRKNAWGDVQHFYPKDWGDKQEAEKNKYKAWPFRDPDTGQIVMIHEINYEDAKRIADASGLRKARKRKGSII